MDEDLLYLMQALVKFLEQEGITCTCDNPPKADRLFWDRVVGSIKTQDREALELIASYLQDERLTDFECIEEIIFLVESRGFSTFPRHDF